MSLPSRPTSRTFAAATFISLLALPAVALEDGSAHVGHAAAWLAVGGPGDSDMSLGASWQINRYVEALAALGASPFQTLRSINNSFESYVLDKRSMTLTARARIWFLDRHNPVLEVGAGATHLEFAGDVQQGGMFAKEGEGHYNRSGTSGFGLAGAGYGFRSANGFRLTFLAGVEVFTASMAAGGMTPKSGALDPHELDTLRQGVDVTTNVFFETRPYLELALGWMF